MELLVQFPPARCSPILIQLLARQLCQQPRTPCNAWVSRAAAGATRLGVVRPLSGPRTFDQNRERNAFDRERSEHHRMTGIALGRKSPDFLWQTIDADGPTCFPLSRPAWKTPNFPGKAS